MKTVQGFILIDVDVVALNNAGKDTSTNLENAVATKKIKKNGRDYPYVSGQAWRYWWRETLKNDFHWNMSPIIRETKIAFTEANPFIYPDDDIFGYMRAKKEGKENITLTRVSPLKNSALIAVAYNPVVQNWSSMTRHEGDAVPYGMDEYCAIMKGMFSIDLDQVGTFSMLARTGFMNINEGMKKEGLANGAVGVEDPLVKDSKGIPVKHLRLPIETRKQRTSQAILALKTLSGGAKLTTNLADVTPKLIILATFNSGNHPFSHLAVEDHGKARFSVQALLQVLHDYREQLAGNVFIGRRAGFMDELENELQEAVAANPVIIYGTVGDAIDNYVNSLNWE